MKSPKTMIADKFDGQRRMRRWENNHFGSMDAVKTHPLACCAFNPDEGGMVSTDLNVRLAPVDGLMRSAAYVEVAQVFVPYQAMEKLELDTQDDAGVTEMTRRRLLAGQGIGLEDANVISEAFNVHPISIGGTPRVLKEVRLAYIAAVNHLRLNAYFDATTATKTETAILPALLTANVLERFNGVLDPERNIDGAIKLTGELPLKGLGKLNGTFGDGTQTVRNSEGGTDTFTNSSDIKPYDNEMFVVEEDPNNAGYPYLRVNMAEGETITLRDMIKSQKLDELIRAFAGLRQLDPVNADEKIERALYGLQVDYDHNCQVMYREVYELRAMHHTPMDGASRNEVSGHFELKDNFTTVVPRSELGGQLVTVAMVKPMETIEKQPDPNLTSQRTIVNRIQDETQLDEQLVVRRQVESDVAAIDEDTPVFWVGHNSLKHDYVTRGPNAQQTFEVDMKSTMWVHPVPTSVTPENINYPAEGISMYPFASWTGGHAEYTIDQRAEISTPLAKGPTPVERIALFNEDPTLLTNE